ncbi:MAG: hypothetical protein HOH61_04990 [Rhodospirillaceae bacterium]|nr:hypothetical protein [Rhodospirillaceae bacterium]
MPFTPIHMGPGILIKSLWQGGFSMTVFGWSQIVMDIQPLIVTITGEGHLHGFSHTYVGATLLAVLAALSGKPMSEFGLAILNKTRINLPTRISWRIAFVTAFVGAYSHVVIDSFMHLDMVPWYPISTSNALLGVIGVGALIKTCLYSGLIGTGIFTLMQARNRK